MTNCANEPGGLGSILSEARFVFFFLILFLFFFCFVFFRYFLFPTGFFSFLAVSPCYVRFGDLRIFSLPVTTYMGKQDGSRFRQIARKIRTGKFYSGIVFPICTKKRAAGARNWYQRWNMNFDLEHSIPSGKNWTAKYSVSVFHFLFNRIFRKLFKR